MRRAFTLVEVVVALTIAGLIALAARAALTAGIDTQERVQQHATLTEGDARFRALLIAALRHMTDAPAVGLTPFVLRDTVLSDGVAGQVAEFYSRGLSLPAGSGSTLRVELTPTQDGLTIHAFDASGSMRFRGVAPGLATMRMRLRTPAGEWLEAWPRTRQVPSAAVVEFTARGGSVAPPLVVATGLGDR